MSWWNRGTDLAERQLELAAIAREAAPAVQAEWQAIVPLTQSGLAMTEDAALAVPAMSRGTRLITGTVAQLPLRQWNGQTIIANQLLAQPEPDQTPWATIQRLTQDLLLHARGYWLVRDVNREGYPTRVKLLPAQMVGDDPNGSDPDAVRWNNQRWAKSHPAGPGTSVDQVICFYGYRQGVLTTGALALATAAELEAAVQRYAETPLPTAVLRNEGADLPDDQVDKLLTRWESSRRKRGTAYLNSALTMQAVGWSSAELQLAEGRNEAAIQIARALSLDPYWLGASVQGSSLTYTNNLAQRRDLLDLTLSDYMLPVEQRLSMRDVTPTQTSNLVQFDTTEFLRGSLQERADLVTQLLPVQAITLEEARQLLAFVPGQRSPLS